MAKSCDFEMTRDVMIVLVGKTGAGKSATGNTILGTTEFKEDFCAYSVTKTCMKKTAVQDGRRVAVIDTPGICELSGDQLHQEIEKCVKLSVPGPHVFLVVIQLGRVTAEERDAVKWIQKNFGDEAVNYTMLLFTRGDQLDKPIEEFVGPNNELREFIERFEHHVFNNKDRSDSTQVTELLAKIDEMVKRNGGQCYTNEMYKEAQRKIREEEERKRQEEEKQKRTEKVIYAAVGAAGNLGLAAVGTAAAAAAVPAAAVVGGISAAVMGVGSIASGAYAFTKREEKQKTYKNP